jgi:hypothetical protein
MQHGPSHVLVIIVSHKVILLLDHIHKQIPSGLDPKYYKLIYGVLIPTIFPLMIDMGEILKECKGDIFFVGKIVNRKITF